MRHVRRFIRESESVWVRQFMAWSEGVTGACASTKAHIVALTGMAWVALGRKS